MSVGRYIMRGRVFQPRVFAPWALANGGQTTPTRFGRFVAGALYQSHIVRGQTYQAGIEAGTTYQAHATTGQIQ